MSTILAPPAPPDNAPSAPAVPPRRWRRRWLVAAILALAGILLAGLVFVEAYAAHYAPLDDAYVSYVQPRLAHHVGSFFPPVGESFDAYVAKCQVGVPLDFGFGLINNGPV